mmetsp:Transcript_69196/g.150573  ORF Transcript_69196/g.150573 Transcript_69196/m.150573 type:complete len:476 (+) Transcript_69196:102-1529(+)
MMQQAKLVAQPGPLADWEVAWRTHIADIAGIGSDVPYSVSVARFRKLLTDGPLSQTDIRENPERFLLAHRVLAELATTLGPGFWIRFTVQFNLFAGTVVALGSPEQVATLKTLQAGGKTGCFGLTEVFAGVNSGLIVNTTCTWDKERQQFLLNCPSQGAHKNWISQGLTADMCVAVADLRVGGKSYGPHAFLMELRRDGKLVEGVEAGDMGEKTIGNDLDNAWLSFTNVWLPKSTLLSRYGDIVNDAYVQKVKGIRTMDMIGQRLYTGRTVIARSSLVFSRQLYANTKKYADEKRCWSPDDPELRLSQIPQLRHLIAEADGELGRLENFMTEIERRLADCLRHEQVPPADLVQAIASAKVKMIESSIDLCWRLKQEVGSFALMTGYGFERIDYLQCCKFAEGDSRILMQKIARDRLKDFQKGTEGPVEEATICKDVLAATKRGDRDDAQMQAYRLADLVINRTLDGLNSSGQSRL